METLMNIGLHGNILFIETGEIIFLDQKESKFATCNLNPIKHL
jgi:hypothetical protein